MTRAYKKTKMVSFNQFKMKSFLYLLFFLLNSTSFAEPINSSMAEPTVLRPRIKKHPAFSKIFQKMPWKTRSSPAKKFWDYGM